MTQQNYYEHAALKQIPSLNVVSAQALRPGSLCRFRGLVQNTFDLDFYMGLYKKAAKNGTATASEGVGDWCTGKYQDVLYVSVAFTSSPACERAVTAAGCLSLLMLVCVHVYMLLSCWLACYRMCVMWMTAA